MKRPTRSLADASRETLLTVALVTVCFGAFFGLVRLSFPEGMSLRGLISGEDRSPWEGAEGARELDVGGGNQEFAKLTRVVRKVMDKPASAIAWQNANDGLSLGDRHSIQTHEQSTATISFDEENSLVLGENSLIVLKSFDGGAYGSSRRASLVVFGGELLGRFGGARGATSMQIQVETPAGVVQLRSGEDEAEETEFRVEVGEDSTSTIAVFRGEAEVTVGEETVLVTADHAVEVASPEAAPIVRVLPGVPRLRGPSTGTDFPYRSQPPEIEFEWSAASAADEYRFVLARDARLETVVLEHVVAGQSLALSGLEHGSYYWTVAGVRDGLRGATGRPRKFRTVRDDVAPKLEVGWPEGTVRHKTVRLTGQTEPGARVFVETEPARTEMTGRFEIDLELVRGANRIVVESVDDVGNSTYESRIIKALY